MNACYVVAGPRLNFVISMAGKVSRGMPVILLNYTPRVGN